MNRLIPDNLANRRTFDNISGLYHKSRPTYPEELFQRLILITALQPKAKAVEIGPGTGQATKPLAEKGFLITATELGSGLADIARQELKDYKNVTVITGAFEDIALPAHSFDLVYSATAFHWVKPEVKFKKPHQLLKNSGHLAIIHTNHVSDGQGDEFFHASQPVYATYYPNNSKEKYSLPLTADIEPTELDNKLFESVDFSCFPMTIGYSAGEYAQLLNTYSPTLALPEDKRTAFLADIEDLINKDFDGKVFKHYAMSLTIGRSKRI